MKYKVGDKVKVKSIEWYNTNRDQYGEIAGGDFYFTSRMSEFCGKFVTIYEIIEDDVYTIQEDGQIFTWTDSMFEDNDLEFQQAITKAVDECLWGKDDETPTEKIFDNDSVEFGKNVMRKKITEYLLKYLPMTPDDKESFIEEMNKNIK